MRQSVIYLENSVFGFYYDEKIENKTKMEATRILFQQIGNGMFKAFTSPLTIRELSEAPIPYRDKLLSLVKDFNVDVADVDETEIETLAEEYVNESIVPEEFKDDARHVAFATILRVDILVTFNLEHIANEWSARKFNAVNLKEGYSPLVIRTPEEVIHYGD